MSASYWPNFETVKRIEWGFAVPKGGAGWIRRLALYRVIPEPGKLARNRRNGACNSGRGVVK